jgi:hypothetical protein
MIPSMTRSTTLSLWTREVREVSTLGAEHGHDLETMTRFWFSEKSNTVGKTYPGVCTATCKLSSEA